MPQNQVDQLMTILASLSSDGQPPFTSIKDMLTTIDATPNGSVPWQCFKVKYCGEIPKNADPPSWMLQEYEVWYRNAEEVVKAMLSNKDFDGEIDYAPYREFDGNGKRIYKDLMSGDWAWLTAVRKHIVTDSLLANILSRIS